jgi:hypothetical protein
MTERKWLGTGCLGFMFLMACNVAKPASQDQREKSFYTSSEYTAFQAADEEKNSHAKIRLLDDFSIKYPDSTLVPQVYRDYYLTYFTMMNYRRTIEYADKFLALGDRIDPGDRLEALTDRAQAFFAGCGDAGSQTPEAYMSAKTAAVQGLQAVSQFPIPPDGLRVEGGSVLPVREHLEALFYAVVGIAESGLKGHIHDSCISKKIEIESIKLFSWQQVSDKRKYAELQEFQETKDLHLLPSARFEVVCELKGEPDLSAGDFLLWTVVDFFVAPVTQEYEEVEADQIGPSTGWDRLAEIQDLKPLPIYSLHPGETRRVVIKDFDLAKVLASFPVGSPDSLWPWFVRLKIHVQDRTGRQIGSAERIVHLSPDSVRKKTSRYQSPSGKAPKP